MEDKYKELLKYSNPTIVKKKAVDIFGKNVKLAVSTRKDKKYMIQRPDGIWSHFGQLPYSDYTKTGDDDKKRRYLQRATAIKGDWANNKYSPNFLSINLLW